jgi:hypothetical protein
VLREVIADVLAEARAYMVPRIAAAGSYGEALRLYVTTNFEYISAHRRKIIAFAEVMNGMPPACSSPTAARPGSSARTSGRRRAPRRPSSCWARCRTGWPCRSG